MRQDVRITQAQADEHYADLRAAIGGAPKDPAQWFARRDQRREARQRTRAAAWWRRLAQA